MNNLASFFQFGLFQIIVWVAAALFLWLAVREIRTWYWKQNEIVTLLKKIEENTRKGGVDDKK